MGFFGDAFGHAGRNGTLDVERMKAAWMELRDELLPTWIEQHPGTRPYAWRRFEAPEPRRQVSPGPESFGCPLSFRGIPHDGMFETEAEYLERLGVLTPVEESQVLSHSR